MKKILLLGASGRTGKHILNQALERGFDVNIVVRDASKIKTKSAQLTIFEGTPSDAAILKIAVQNCDFVISALNISRNSDFPWAALRTEKNFLSGVVSNLIQIFKSNPIKHLIIISAWGVHETKKDIPFWFRWTIDVSNIRFGYLEHENQETILEVSSINWTSVRPAGLTNFEADKEVLVSFDNKPKPNLLISRKNVAKFILDILGDTSYFGKTPAISE